MLPARQPLRILRQAVTGPRAIYLVAPPGIERAAAMGARLARPRPPSFLGFHRAGEGMAAKMPAPLRAIFLLLNAPSDEPSTALRASLRLGRLLLGVETGRIGALFAAIPLAEPALGERRPAPLAERIERVHGGAGLSIGAKVSPTHRPLQNRWPGVLGLNWRLHPSQVRAGCLAVQAAIRARRTALISSRRVRSAQWA